MAQPTCLLIEVRTAHASAQLSRAVPPPPPLAAIELDDDDGDPPAEEWLDSVSVSESHPRIANVTTASSAKSIFIFNGGSFH
jgi:hypothetical protein